MYVQWAVVSIAREREQITTSVEEKAEWRWKWLKAMKHP